MRTIGRVIVVVAVVAALGAGAYLLLPEPRQTGPRPLDDRVFVLDGRETTCSDLFGEPCGDELQREFDRWGHDLGRFVDSTTFGPYGDALPFAAAAKLSLQACWYARSFGKTVLEFVDLARHDHPDASFVDLAPFWDRTRFELCPQPWR